MIVNDFGVMLGHSGERLVVPGPRPRLDLVEGARSSGCRSSCPLPGPLRLVTSSGVKEPTPSLRLIKPMPGSRAAMAPSHVELPLFLISEIVVASRGLVFIPADLRPALRD